MQGPAAGAVHEGQRHQGHADHDGSDTHGRELGRLVRQTRRCEERRRVIEHLERMEGSDRIGKRWLEKQKMMQE